MLICTAQERIISAHAEAHHDSHACGCRVKEEDVLLDKERTRKARQDKSGGLEAATAADSCCCCCSKSPSAPQIRLLAGCAGRRRRRRRLRPLAAAQPPLSAFGRMAASRPSAAPAASRTAAAARPLWPLRGQPRAHYRGQQRRLRHSAAAATASCRWAVTSASPMRCMHQGGAKFSSSTMHALEFIASQNVILY